MGWYPISMRSPKHDVMGVFQTYHDIIPVICHFRLSLNGTVHIRNLHTIVIRVNVPNLFTGNAHIFEI